MQVCVQPPASSISVALPAFAAELRRPLHGARSTPAAVDQLSCRQGAQQQTRRTPLLL